MKKTNDYQRRHHDDDIYDDVRIACVPRYKTSGLSGDEWRFSYVLSFARKGTTLFERGYTSLKAAIAALPWVSLTMHEGGCDGFDEKAWQARTNLDATTCANPGCPQPATVRYRFKQIFATNGEGPLPGYEGCCVTQFCDRHSTRGDCGREDSDDNYERIEGKPKAPLAKDESPSAFGGVVNVPPGGDIGQAVDAALKGMRKP